jgi:hypothetical protein
MLTDANQDNTLAQAARTAAAAAAARVPKRSNPKRGRVDQPASQFPPPRYGTDQMSRGGRGGRGRSDRGRGQPANPWLQGGRRYVAQNSKHLPPCKTAPQSHLVPHAQTEVPSNPVGGSWPHTGPQAVAARLKLFAARWPAVTSDQWVLEAVREGITIDFVSEPIQKFLPPQITMSVEMSAVCDAEVRELLSKRAISEVTDGSPGFVCSFFCIKKKQPGQFRPIVNLKPLNKFIRYQHFKMENLESVRFLVRKGDWLAKVDLKDAYFTVAVKKSHHKFLRFRWKDRVFEFSCMAFGLAPAPRIFTKILKTVMAFLRRQGIRLVIYLDDILILNESKSGLEADINTVIDLLQSLGFLINWEKSIVVPTQTIEYLGLIVDSTDPSFSLPSSKAEAVKRMCEGALSEGRVSLRTLASIQGNFSWAIPAIPFAQAHYRSLQRFYILNAQRVDFNLEAEVCLSPGARLDLNWWVANIEKANGKMFFSARPRFRDFLGCIADRVGSGMQRDNNAGPLDVAR